MDVIFICRNVQSGGYMGVVHKLKPEIIDFIIENKKNNPSLSCRNLTQLILEKFQAKVSKSSINSIFKENNLSMPIGRRPKPKKKKFNLPVLPVIEGTKAVTVVEGSNEIVIANPPKAGEAISLPEIASSASPPRNDTENMPPRNDTPGVFASPEGAKQSRNDTEMEDKRLKEAEEWAKKLQEEERTRIEKKLELEKQKPQIDDAAKAEEEELKALLDEAFRIKTEEEAKRIAEEKAAQEAAKRIEAEKQLKEEAEKKRLEDEKAAKEAAEKKRLADEKVAQEAVERKRLEEEKAAQEAELRAEKERWAKLSEEEAKRIEAEKQLKAAEKRQPAEEKVVLPKEEPVTASALAQENICSGAILLKALDCLVGSSKEINEVISKALRNRPEDFINLTEALIMRSLSVDSQYSQEKLDNYYAQIQKIENIKADVDRIISNAFMEARGVKLHFIDGSIVLLDSQMHSSWSTQYIPYDFSSTVYELKNNLNKYFFQGLPLVLFTAAGYDIPANDFFNLLLNISSISKRPDALTLFGNKLEDMEKISLGQKAAYSLIFGLWPWQFSSSRKVKRIGEFNLRQIKEINRDLYLAEIEIDLLRTSMNQTVSLKGCAIKLDLNEKIRLVVLSSEEGQPNLEKLAGAYLNCWPNLEEAFQDFSRKIELFAYVGNTQKFFSKDNFGIDLSKPALELEETFANYVKMLDAYLRWHFLPAGYAEKDFALVNECFYKLPVKLEMEENRVKATIQISQEYKYQKDVEYLSRRLNERQISLACGRQIYFETAFK